MSGRARDTIVWAPPNVRGAVVRMADAGHALLHRCTSAVLVTNQSREQLDPMALGTCRYCGERLPVFPSQETTSSDASPQ